MVAPVFKQAWVVSGILANIVGVGIVMAYPYSLLRAINLPDSDIKADVEIISWLASANGIAGIFGIFITSSLMGRLGRKFVHLITLTPGIVGWLIIYFSTNIVSILIGRILCGLTVGCTVSLGVVIIGEYTSPENRGMFLNLKTVSTYVGAITLHVISQYNDWRTVALYSIIPILFSFINICTWPESPTWLASEHRFEECKKNFLWLRGTSKSSMAELEALISRQSKGIQTNILINTNLRESPINYKKQIGVFINRIIQKTFYKPLIIIWLGFNLIEAAGRHYFPGLAMELVKRLTNEIDTSKSFYYVVIMDLIVITGSSASCVLVKIIKTRTLLFFSGIPSVLILLSIVVFLYLANYGIIDNDKPWIPLTMFVLYLFFVNLGCTPIPLAWLGELFPLEHKSVGVAVSGMINSFSMILTLKTTPVMLVSLDVYGTFLIFSLVMIVCLTYFYFTLPETKNRTLLEIEDFFHNGRFLDEEKNDVSGMKMLEKDVTS